jgi:hypothetical protein
MGTFLRKKTLLLIAVLVLVAGFVAARQAQHKRQHEGHFTPAQAQTLNDWSYALALNAATWRSPAVIMYALRSNDAVGPNPKAKPNSLWRMENLTTSSIAEQEGYVLPNDSVLYGFGFLDLRREPIILSLPDSEGRYLPD